VGSSNPRTFYDYNQLKVRNEDALKVSSSSSTSYEWDPVVHLYPGTDWNVSDIAVNFRWKRLLQQDNQDQYVAALTFRWQMRTPCKTILKKGDLHNDC
jgi:hypothetical protein